MTKKKKILFIVNQAKYFISHRLVIAREAQKKVMMSMWQFHLKMNLKL